MDAKRVSSPKVVLVTGSTGFVGRAVVEGFQRAGHVVYPFSRSDGFDVRRKSDFAPFFDKKIDVVLHCAGSTFVPDSWRCPSDFYETNVMGTQHVLDFCQEVKARLVFVSSYLYGVPRYLPIDENHPITPNNPYAHSKWLAEDLCRFYASEMGVSSVVLRPFNLYGPGQAKHFLIPTIIRQALAGQVIVVKDDAPRRDYLHITDFVKACLCSLKQIEEPFLVFNVGSGYSLSVREIIDVVLRSTGSVAGWRSEGVRRKNEIPDTVSDCRYIAQELGWKPEHSFYAGIESLI